MSRNKAYLNNRLKHFLEFGERSDVPIHLGKIGLVHVCYQGKGGLHWIADVLDILAHKGVGFFYWDFQSQAMGLIDQPAEEKINEKRVNHALSLTSITLF